MVYLYRQSNRHVARSLRALLSGTSFYLLIILLSFGRGSYPRNNRSRDAIVDLKYILGVDGAPRRKGAWRRCPGCLDSHEGNTG